MKFLIKEVLDISNKIGILVKEPLYLPVNYKIRQLVKKMEDPINFWQEKRNEIIQKYGDATEDGQISVTDEEKIKLANIEINEVLETEIDLDIVPFKIDDFRNIEIKYEDLSQVFMDKLIQE